MLSLFQRLKARRWVRRCLWSLFIFLGLLLLVWQCVNWKGARELAHAKEMLAADGESLDLHEIMPDPIPDAENFCAIPLLKDFLVESAPIDGEGEPSERAKRFKAACLPKGNDSATQPRFGQGAAVGRPTDLKAWAEWLKKFGSVPLSEGSEDPAHTVLAALSKDDALLGELAAGLNRPHAQWTPAWKSRKLPEDVSSLELTRFSPLWNFTKMLQLRSIAAARAGDAAKAHEALQIAIKLNQAGEKEPFLIGLLVAQSSAGEIAHSVWEVCDAHAGNVDDFRALGLALSQLDFEKAALLAVRTETVFERDSMVRTKKNPALLFATIHMHATPDPGPWQAPESLLIPGGWLDMNLATFLRWQHDFEMKPLRDGGFRALVDQQSVLESTIQQFKVHPFAHLDAILPEVVIGGVGMGVRSAAYTQCLLNQATVACALECYRIENQSYPETLEALALPNGKALPLDVLTGKPMGYRRSAPNHYTLWCAGFDEKDDGGKRVSDEKNPERTRFNRIGYKGDWVWDFPE